MKTYNKPTMDVNEFVIDWSILCSSTQENPTIKDGEQ